MGYVAFYVICPRASSQYVTPLAISMLSILNNCHLLFVQQLYDDRSNTGWPKNYHEMCSQYLNKQNKQCQTHKFVAYIDSLRNSVQWR